MATATSTSPTAGNNRVLKLAAGSTTQTVLPFTGLNHPAGVAVDTAGNLYVVDWGNNRVLKLAAGSTTQAVLPFTGLNDPDGVAVDAAGNLYVTDRTTTGAETGGRLDHPDRAAVHRPHLPRCGGGYRRQPLRHRQRQQSGAETGGGLVHPDRAAVHRPQRPHGVAVDGAGNLYVTDNGNNRVLKLAAGSTTPTVLPFTGLNAPRVWRWIGAGNLYVTAGGRVLKLAAGATTQTVLPFTGLNGAAGVAVDGAGNLYITDVNNSRVLKLPAG